MVRRSEISVHTLYLRPVRAGGGGTAIRAAVRTQFALLAFVAIGAWMGQSLPAQKLMELRLKDGRVLVGQVQSQGDIFRVRTHDGQVTVASDDVASQREKSELQQALKELQKRSGDGAFVQIQLARQARDFGLEREMWRYLDRAAKALGMGKSAGATTSKRPKKAAAKSAITRQFRDLLAELEPQLLPSALRQAPSKERVRGLLRLFCPETSPGKSLAIDELLVREAGADQLLRQFARRSSSPTQRIAALRALHRRTLSGNDRFVLRTAILDRSNKVRTAAVEISRSNLAADDVVYVAAGLAHENALVRVRTAEALASLDHRAAIAPLVKAGPHAATGLVAAAGDGISTRGHIAFLHQQAYIRDYNVEVAQAAFIADPVVDVIQSGSVLDVTVAGVTEIRTIVRAYRSALKRLAGADPGADPRRWASWLVKLPPPAAAAKRSR